MRITLFFYVITVALLAVSPVWADKEEAKKAFLQGASFFEEGKYEDAAEAFRRAYEADSHWKVLYNIAQSEMAAQRYGRAMEAFEQFMVLGGDNIALTRQQEVEAELDRLQRLVGFVDVSAPDGAEVFVDGHKRGTMPLSGRLMIAAGVEHDLQIIHNGQKLHGRQIKVSGRQSVSVIVPKDNGGKQPVEKPVVAKSSKNIDLTPPPPPARWHGKLMPTGVALLAAGGASMAASLIIGAVALKRSNDLSGDCDSSGCPPEYHDKNDSVDKLSLTSNILLFAGAGIAATGAVLFIIGKKRRDRERLVKVTPHVAFNTAGIVLGGTF